MLVVDDKWLLIGPNRHGSLYAAAVLQATFSTRPIGGSRPSHTPLCKMHAADREGKVVVGIVRCPLQWYVSKWCTFWDHAAPDKRCSFQDYFWAHWRNPHGPIGKAMEDLPLSRAEIGGWSYMHVAYHCLGAREMLATMTRDELAARYLAWCSADHIMCTATLCDDLVRVFGERVRVHLDQSRNASSAGAPLQYYTPEQLAAIRERDGWLVALYPQLRSPLCC